MTASRLLVHEAIGETRAAILDAGGRMMALYHDRWADHGARVRWGETHKGTIRKVSASDGGAFVTLSNGVEGFFSRRDPQGLVEGARGLYRVRAEARADKLARLEQADEEETRSAFELWLGHIPEADQLQTKKGASVAEEIDAAFDAALSSVVGLPGGGRLQIMPTPALTAIDIDTIGRLDQGRASERAARINRLAAAALARQAALRNLGGALVLDCISPLAGKDLEGIRSSFLQGFAALNTRQVDCLRPSRFGLMEIVLEWRYAPLLEAYQNHDGQNFPLAVVLKGLRELERAAKAQPMASLTLALPNQAFKAYQEHRSLYDAALQERLGGRCIVEENVRDALEVYQL